MAKNGVARVTGIFSGTVSTRMIGALPAKLAFHIRFWILDFEFSD